MTTQSWKDLKKTAEDASKPLPADWYNVVVEKAESTMSSTNKPMIKVVLVVTSGPQANNRKVWTQFVFSPDSPFALQMFFKNLAAFGLNDSFFDSLPPNPEQGMGIIAESLIGLSARAKIEPRTFNGVERDNVIELAAGQGSGSVAPRPAGVGSVAPAPGGAPTAPIPAGASPVVAPATPQVPPTPTGGGSTPPQPVF